MCTMWTTWRVRGCFINRVFMIGRLSQDPEIRYTPNGKAVCSFSILVTYQTKVREETEYIDCIAWDALAEKMGSHLAAGCRVAVEGRLHTRLYDGVDGPKKKITEVVVRDVEILDEVCPASQA